MAIIGTPATNKQNVLYACTICKRKMPLDQLTVGPTDAMNQQMFACYGHTWDASNFILGWTAFAIKQRQLTISADLQTEYKNVPVTRQFYLEKRPVTGGDVISWDIAHHLFTRQLQGTIVVITSNPSGLLAALCKQWVRVTRKVQRERSSTLDATIIEQLTNTIARMQNMAFTSKLPYEYPYADVYVLSHEQLKDIPLNCRTLYIADAVEDDQLKAIKESLPRIGLLVFYR